MTNDMDSAYMENVVNQHINMHYGINVQINTLVRGVDITFSLTDQEDIIAYARLYNENRRNINHINNEMLFLKSLIVSKHLNVARPINNLSGNHITNVTMPNGSERHLVLFTPANGQKLTYQLDDMYHLGKSLFELHNSSYDKNIMFISWSDYINESIINLNNMPDNVHRIFSLAISDLESSSVLENDLSRGICHGDMRIENARIEKNNITFFDFEDLFYGSQVYDLASVLYWLETSNSSTAHNQWISFLKGYGPVDFCNFEKRLRYYLVIKQIRMLNFLSKFCKLEPNVWDLVYKDAIELVTGVHNGKIKTLNPLIE